jgi:hypothetical protein
LRTSDGKSCFLDSRANCDKPKTEAENGDGTEDAAQSLAVLLHDKPLLLETAEAITKAYDALGISNELGKTAFFREDKNPGIAALMTK